MSDVDEIIDYIRQLKKGFDKELFQNKIEELAYVAETTGLDVEEFHILFKIWLNLSIPITKWISLGSCLVPEDQIEERTVDYAFRWLLANCDIHANFSRMAFLLDWLTAAMDSDSIDIKALDSGYEIFYTLLSYEVLTAHSLKLVYTLTKPSDVSRKRVLELLDLAKKREGKKNMYHQIHVLLGLFKSYKPECVPEDIPAISVHTSFKKINVNLQARFKKRQELRHSTTKERHHLMWINPLNSEGKKKADPLVPNMEFCNISSKQYGEKEQLKPNLDFSDPVSLVSASVRGGAGRPARLRALLCNQAGLVLAALHADHAQAFLAHHLHHLLTECFLASSPHSYSEKADLLNRLGALQRTLLQGIPVITRFLAQYLPFWNEKDYFHEILNLVEWVSVDNADQVSSVMDPLMKAYYRARPMEQCAILTSLTNMYRNLVYSSTRPRHHFMSSQPSSDLSQVLPQVAASIHEMCQKGLQISPEDMRVLVWSGRWWRAGAGAGAGGVARCLSLALPLLAPSALLLDHVAAMLVQYKIMFKKAKAANKHNEENYITSRTILKAYSMDYLNTLYYEQMLAERKIGIVFDKLHPQLVAKLSDLVPNVQSLFSIRNNLAFAPYTYMHLRAVDPSDATNKLCFDTVISHAFPNLSEVLLKSIPELH